MSDHGVTRRLAKLPGFSAQSVAARHSYQFAEDEALYIQRMIQAGYPE